MPDFEIVILSVAERRIYTKHGSSTAAAVYSALLTDCNAQIKAKWAAVRPEAFPHRARCPKGDSPYGACDCLATKKFNAASVRFRDQHDPINVGIKRLDRTVPKKAKLILTEPLRPDRLAA